MADDQDPDAALRTFFEGRPEASALFEVVRDAIQAAGASDIRVTRSQVAFRRRRAFAWAWTPDRYLQGDTAPLVLSVALDHRDRSPRWKEVVQPSTAPRWMHHLELRDAAEVDADVRAWIAEAWAAAG